MSDNPGGADDPDVMTVVNQLNTYLREHPNSADTAEGIARWWFTGPPLPTTEQVTAALRWMQSLGVVEAQHAADGRVRYRLRRTQEELGDHEQAELRPPHTGEAH